MSDPRSPSPVRLAAARGSAPDVIDGVGHAIYLDPDLAAAYIGQLN